MRMQVAVYVDQTSSGLLVVRQGLSRPSGQAQHRRQVHQSRVVQVVRAVGFQAEIMGLAGQFLRADEITNGAPTVYQADGSPERVHVIYAQILAVPLEHMLALLEGI